MHRTNFIPIFLQFPLTVSFAMTIKKSQRQSILITDEDGEDTNVTSNVVYKEVFCNV
ncbi:hypothetical protein MTR_0105s0100 [Medicago truncatula]|uniref:Transmembrane protein n=1 Tax=Medicago truncatula TaxID=3880 RepID=A0A072TGN6_MEDTR|nr:hypothetical protein MTR_0105s0100 [Medicago truncatula]